MAGTIQPLGGGAPAPDAARVAAIRASMAYDAEAGATFAEVPRAALAALVERATTASGTAPYAEAATLLAHIRDRIAGLDPARLEPRGGLAGLFDSRGKRLKAFRVAFAAAADTGAAASADLLERAGVIGRRGDDLETVWTGIREAVTDLDAHIAAARDALSDPMVPSPVYDPVPPPEAAAAFEDAAEEPVAAPPHPLSEDGPVERQADAEAAVHVVQPAAETATRTGPEAVEVAELPTETGSFALTPVATLPHPLEARLEILLGLRATAIACLPLVRAAQNADQGVPATIATARNATEAWMAETREALGLSGKRPKKVRPDASRLAASCDGVIATLSSAERIVTTAQARLAELNTRVTSAISETRIAA